MCARCRSLRLGSPVVAARLWPRPIHCPGFLSGRGAGPPASSRGWGRTRCVPLPPSPADAATCEKTGPVRPRSRPLALDSLAVSGFRVQGQRGWGSPEPVFGRSRRAPRFGAGIGEFWQAPLDRATRAAQPPPACLAGLLGCRHLGVFAATPQKLNNVGLRFKFFFPLPRSSCVPAWGGLA